MGSPSGPSDEQPAHPVVLSRGFWMGKTPVTRDLWRVVHGAEFGYSAASDAPVRPIEGPTWDRAVALCEQLTNLWMTAGVLSAGERVSLPTEAQWEYACRAGTTTPWYFGASESDLREHAWYRSNSDDDVHAVAQKKPNPWGLHDLYGNVLEWCLDSPAKFGAAESIDPTFQDGDLRIVRGGSYAHDAQDCRSARRQTVRRDDPFGEPVGFRIVIINR